MIIEKERQPMTEIEDIRSPVVPAVDQQIIINKSLGPHNGFIGGPQKRNGLKLVLWMWMAALIDYLLILAGSLLALVLFSMIVKSTSTAVLKTFLHPQQINLTFLSLLILVGWTYFIVSRAFMGASIGEKFCDLRLGKPSERLHPLYIVRLLGRTSLVAATGIVVIPILSLLFKKDLAGKFSGGLYIYSLK